MLVQVRKTTAQSLFNAGITIRLLPNKIRLDNDWILAQPINIKNQTEHSFDVLLAQFRYYNCTAQTGKDIHYYIEEIKSFTVVAVGGTIMKKVDSSECKNIINSLMKELDSLVNRKIPIQDVSQDGSNILIIVG